jgi:chorismate dehydratase
VPDRQPLRIGCVKYLNARPLVFGGPADVVLDHPSVLCAQLAHGELDVALVSSFEFLRNPIYRIVDGISISSDGPVYSVVVAHVGEISAAEQIELDPAAETSGNLLRCLLSELKLRPRFVATSTSSLAKERARLLIGDQAIRFRQQHGNEFQFWDLGENWQNLAGLPFVYALWLVRPEVVDPKSIADRLRTLRNKNLANIDNLIAGEKEFDRGFCDRYYREHLRFSFGEREKEGLRAFKELCQKHDLLPKRDIAFSVV